MSRGNTIINNASIDTYTGRPDLIDYTSTKGAIMCSLALSEISR